MCPFVLTSKDKGRQDGRAILTVEGCLNISKIEKRIKEAEKLGFKKCIIPESNKKLLKDTYKLDIIGVQNISEAMRCLELKR